MAGIESMLSERIHHRGHRDRRENRQVHMNTHHGEWPHNRGASFHKLRIRVSFRGTKKTLIPSLSKDALR
jgi:hypothetical protein